MGTWHGARDDPGHRARGGPGWPVWVKGWGLSWVWHTSVWGCGVSGAGLQHVPMVAVVVEHRGWCHWHGEVEQVMIEVLSQSSKAGAGVSTRFTRGVEAEPALKEIR